MIIEPIIFFNNRNNIIENQLPRDFSNAAKCFLTSLPLVKTLFLNSKIKTNSNRVKDLQPILALCQGDCYSMIDYLLL